MVSPEYINDLMDHKGKVAGYLHRSANELFLRALMHDNSKFSPEEYKIYERTTPLLKTLTYGSKEYQEALKDLGPALEHHYAHNDHHPEHFVHGINNMNLFQIIEMVCDWMAAVERMQDGDINVSLEINKRRFGIDDQLFQVICNTVKTLESKR